MYLTQLLVCIFCSFLNTLECSLFVRKLVCFCTFTKSRVDKLAHEHICYYCPFTPSLWMSLHLQPPLPTVLALQKTLKNTFRYLVEED